MAFADLKEYLPRPSFRVPVDQLMERMSSHRSGWAHAPGGKDGGREIDKAYQIVNDRSAPETRIVQDHG